MTYRSDHDAALHRLDTLERELAELRAKKPAEAIAIYRRGMTGAQTRALIPFLADAYLLAGQKDSAVAYYEKFVESKSLYFAMFYEGAYLAHARQRLAQLYEERGEFDRAYAMYAALADQWRNADAELQPAVRGYRERMRALERRRGG